MDTTAGRDLPDTDADRRADFEDWVRAEDARLFRLALAIVTQPDVAADAVQDTFESAWFELGFADIAPTGAGGCPIASRLEVTSPNAYHALVIAARIDACQGRLFVSPVAGS